MTIMNRIRSAMCLGLCARSLCERNDRPHGLRVIVNRSRRWRDVNQVASGPGKGEIWLAHWTRFVVDIKSKFVTQLEHEAPIKDGNLAILFTEKIRRRSIEFQHERLSLRLRLRSCYSSDPVTWLQEFYWPACCTNHIGLAVGVLIARPRSYRMVIPKT
jgi:hypothetical protein